MDSSTEAPQLRSLRIGEIFDRATTMYVRNFSVFTLIVLTLLAPTAIVRYLLLGEQAGDFTQLFQEMSDPRHARAMAPASASLLLTTLTLSIVVLLLAPFVNNAVAAGVAMLYDGERPNYALAFRRVFARGWQLLGTLLLCALIVIGIYVAIVILLVVASAITFSMFQVGGARAAAIAFIALAALVLLSAIALAAVASVFALYATTLEGQYAMQAVRGAFGRLFNRRELPKALLLTLAYIALEVIALIVTGSVSLLIGSLTRSQPLEQAFATGADAILNAYITILLAVYYFDVRTRAEGLDLEVEIARLSSAR